MPPGGGSAGSLSSSASTSSSSSSRSPVLLPVSSATQHLRNQEEDVVTVNQGQPVVTLHPQFANKQINWVHFTAPNPDDEDKEFELPPGFAKPDFALLLRNINISIKLYGGRDFNPHDQDLLLVASRVLRRKLRNKLP